MPKASRAKSMPCAKRFDARLERLRSRLNWIIVRIPFDAVQAWGLRGQIKVKGEINGFAFRTSLFPTREGWHFLLVNKRMQKGARAFEGSVARFQMELDSEERTVTIPDELKRILSEDRSLRRWYDGLNHSTRSDIAKWTTEPKSGEARIRRVEQIAERLLNVMEAEQELPPILQVAFRRQPQARAGWEAMTPVKRRGHLMGIFYYKSPESRQKRADKAVAEALKIARAAESTHTTK